METLSIPFPETDLNLRNGLSENPKKPLLPSYVSYRVIFLSTTTWILITEKEPGQSPASGRIWEGKN